MAMLVSQKFLICVNSLISPQCKICSLWEFFRINMFLVPSLVTTHIVEITSPQVSNIRSDAYWLRSSPHTSKNRGEKRHEYLNREKKMILYIWKFNRKTWAWPSFYRKKNTNPNCKRISVLMKSRINYAIKKISKIGPLSSEDP